MAENILPQLLHGHIRLMLGRNYNSFHPCRDSVPVLHGDLGFPIWQQIGQNSLLPHKGKALCQRMGKLNGQRHQVFRFLACVTKHHALISCAVFHRIRLLHTHVDIGGLLMDIHCDLAGVCVKAIAVLHIPDIPNHLPGNSGIVHTGSRGDLAENVDPVGNGSYFAGYMGMGIVFQKGIQNGIGDLVTYLIRVSRCDAFRGKEGCHFAASPFFFAQLQLHNSVAVGVQFFA